MPYEIGLDEAGYGPNLGPFVMTMVMFETKDAPLLYDGWRKLAPIVRRQQDPKDHRLVVDDSKQVYSRRQGLLDLEKNLWPFLYTLDQPATFSDLWIDRVLHEPLQDQDAPWLQLQQPWILNPECINPRVVQQLATCTHQAGYRFIAWHSIILFPRHCNALIHKWNSKASLPLHSIEQLYKASPWPEKAAVTIDRLGGRQHYHAFLQQLCPDRFVTLLQESPQLSRYRLGQDTTIQFVVHAEQQSLPVALASMLSKYLRERLMQQFNAYWCGLMPELVPTAGYPVDAQRWWQATVALRAQLQVDDHYLWRMR